MSELCSDRKDLHSHNRRMERNEESKGGLNRGMKEEMNTLSHLIGPETREKSSKRQEQYENHPLEYKVQECLLPFLFLNVLNEANSLSYSKYNIHYSSQISNSRKIYMNH